MARLEHWSLVSVGNYAVLYGYIFDDAQHRFPDGHFICTSWLRAMSPDAKTATTMNTTYQLGMPAISNDDVAVAFGYDVAVH